MWLLLADRFSIKWSEKWDVAEQNSRKNNRRYPGNKPQAQGDAWSLPFVLDILGDGADTKLHGT